MRLIEKIVHFIAPAMVNQDQLAQLVASEVKRMKASLPAMANYDPNNEGFRRMSGSDRDLSPMDQDRMFELAYWMFDTSAMFKRLAKMDSDFLFADPILIQAVSPSVQEIFNNFLLRHNFDITFTDRMMWLSILGEQCWPVTVDPSSGAVTIGYLDPASIKDVAVFAADHSLVHSLIFNTPPGNPDRTLRLIHLDLNPLHKKTFGYLIGECFFFALNHPPNSPRGRSDFRVLFDWIDGFERYGFNYLDRAELLMNFIWDVTLNGCDETKIKEWLVTNGPPDPGAVRAHNENVKWEAVTPKLNATDVAAGFNMGKSFIMGAAGRPDSWFGSGGKVYSSEADLMGLVPTKDFKRRSRLYGSYVREILDFVLSQAVIAGALSPGEDITYTVTMPKISRSDFTAIAASLPQLVTSLKSAKEEGWITDQTGSRIFVASCNQMGEEIDSEDEFSSAQKEKEERILIAEAKEALALKETSTLKEFND